MEVEEKRNIEHSREQVEVIHLLPLPSCCCCPLVCSISGKINFNAEALPNLNGGLGLVVINCMDVFETS